MKFRIVLGLLLIGGVDVDAQTVPNPEYKITVSGTVQNRDGVLLKGAEVIAGELHAVTNDSGAFTLAGIPGGSVLIVVRRIGYMPATLAFESDPTLRSMTVAAVLTPAAVSLGTIVIEGKTLSQDLWKNGFYRRRDLGMGFFFDPERMARAGMNVSTVVSDAPGIRIARGPAGKAVPTARSGTNYCALNIYLDGNYLPWASEVGIDNVIAPGDVLAIEVYPRASQVPMSFSSGKSTTDNSGMTKGGISLDGGAIDCGVIMIWSKPLGEAAQK